MGFPTNNQNAGIETPVAEARESTLSPTAQFVHEVMDRYVMPQLRDKGLVRAANEIVREGYDKNHSAVIDFLVNCRQVEADILATAKAQGADEKTSAVIRNYFAKMVASIKGGAAGAESLE